MKYLGQEMIASNTTLGVVKVGNNLSINPDGTLHGNNDPDCITIKQETFTVEPGQTVFNLTKGSYNPGGNSIFWYMYGLKQVSEALIETSATTFEILGEIPEGVDILVEYIETVNVTVGLKGDQGIQGVKGDTGVQGIQGPTGLTGSKGDKGDTGAVGPKGDKGDGGLIIISLTEPVGLQTDDWWFKEI